MKRIILTIILVLSVLLSGCGPQAESPSAPDTLVPKEGETTEGPEEVPPTEEPCEDLGLPGEMAGKCWSDILEEAKGQTVNYYHWGGSDVYNTFYADVLGGMLKDRFEINLQTVPIAAPTEFVNKIVNEAAAGVDEGSVDTVWINAENFRTVKQADALYCGWAENLPNSKYVDWGDPRYTYDAGTPTEGCESPIESSLSILVMDTACVSEPPGGSGYTGTIDGLEQWIKDNPGKFTYVAPPQFTGTLFLVPLFYNKTGGGDQWQGPWDAEKQALFDEKAPAFWDWLNELEPYLWREGETYPESLPQMDDLFANSEICFNQSVWPLHTQTMIDEGRYPDTARSFIFKEGTSYSNSFLALPKNSANKAAVLVMADFVMSPEYQLLAAGPDYVRNLPGISIELLPEEYQEKFANLDLGEASVPYDVLFPAGVPQFSGEMYSIIEKGWEENVLKK